MLRTSAPLIGALGALGKQTVDLKAADAFIRASRHRRAIAFVLAAWIATVLAYAITAAYRDGVDPYAFNYLALLIAGVPVALSLAVYAFSLGSARVRRTLAIVVGAVALGTIALAAAQYRAKQLEFEEHIRTVESRKAAKREQDTSDLATYGESCQASCAKSYDSDIDCVKRCAVNRGDSERREKWRTENAPCDVQCAADTSPICNVSCALDKEIAP